MKILHISFFLISLVACTPQQKFNRAHKAETKGDLYKAWQLYQNFAVSNPKHPKAPEALFRAGWLAEKGRKDCYMAGTFYDRVMEKYPQSAPWARLAALYKNNCPDYFPIDEGWQWTEGDSETLGKNARIEIIAKKPEKRGLDTSFVAGILSRTYYAGTNKFRTVEYLYKKTGPEILESQVGNDPRTKIILQWPLEAGHRWQTKFDNRTYQYEITATDAQVKVSGGDFTGCLHVKSSIEGTTGTTNEFYAPGVGKVLTTVSSKEGDKRITELLSYKAPPLVTPDFGNE